MKKMFAVSLVLAVALAVGCSKKQPQTTPTGTGTGTQTEMQPGEGGAMGGDSYGGTMPAGTPATGSDEDNANK